MNTALKSLNNIVPQIRFLDGIGGRLHPTFYKNWDLGLFTSFILERYDESAGILDVGCVSNPLLFNLATAGYSTLCGIDFQLPAENIHTHPHVWYTRADLTQTPFKDRQFDCITSLSVVEHGVDLERYFREMSRILKAGGVLLTSTDYWPKKVRTWTVPRRLTFGVPWKIFSEAEIREFIGVSQRYGFILLAPLECTVTERVVHWLGKAYTFIALAFEKRPL